jgi:hypothetical protein
MCVNTFFSIAILCKLCIVSMHLISIRKKIIESKKKVQKQIKVFSKPRANVGNSRDS